MIEAEKEANRVLENILREEIGSIVRASVNGIEFSLDKLLEQATDDSIKANKEHIDSIYHHVGMIKGTL